MTEDQEGIIWSYHDNCSIKQIHEFIGDKVELDRLNKWRNTEWTQEMLNDVLREALRVRMLETEV